MKAFADDPMPGEYRFVRMGRDRCIAHVVRITDSLDVIAEPAPYMQQWREARRFRFVDVLKERPTQQEIDKVHAVIGRPKSLSK